MPRTGSIKHPSDKTKSPVDSHYNNPNFWWSYKQTLDEDLVVITPSSESTSGPSLAGELPLAKHPQFPYSHNTFLKNLISHSEIKKKEAMINAMSLKN